MLENKRVLYTFRKNGVFYFARRVPRDLAGHYTAARISFSLHTRSPSVASSRAARAAHRLEEHWYFLRLQNCDLPGKHLLRDRRLAGLTEQQGTPDGPEAPTHSEAVGIYLRLRGKDRPTTFHRTTERSCGVVIDVCGDKAISAYSKADANAVRDHLIEGGLAGSSIARIFVAIRSVVNFAASESGIEIRNSMAKTFFLKR